MNITQSDWITVTYLFLIVGGLITLFGGLIVWLSKKPKRHK